MKTLGIFGDSYAEHFSRAVTNRNVWPADLTVDDIRKEYPCWGSLLPFNTTTHAAGGADVQHCLTTFLEHQQKYDKIIVVITHVGRHTFNVNNQQFKITNAASAEQFMREWKNDPMMHKLLGAIRDNMTHVYPFTNERDILFWELCVAHIRQVRPDAKFILAFNPGDQLTNTIKLNLNSPMTGLHDIYRLENALIYGNKDIEPFAKWDARMGHLTTESHLILRDLILKQLDTDDQWLNFDIKEFKDINPDINRYRVDSFNTVDEWIKYNNINTGIDDGK